MPTFTSFRAQVAVNAFEYNGQYSGLSNPGKNVANLHLILKSIFKAWLYKYICIIEPLPYNKQ